MLLSSGYGAKAIASTRRLSSPHDLSREDRDSRILCAFLQSLARTKVEGQPVFIALRRPTERAVFQAVRAERVHADAVPIEIAGEQQTPFHGELGPFVACLAHEVARRLLAGKGA